MISSLGQFIRRYVALSDGEMEDLASRFRTKLVRKGDYLLRQGDICKDLVFVEKGCLRLYYMQDDIEVSVWFAFQHTSAIEISSFISGQPSNYFIQAIEDSDVLSLPKTEIDRLYASQPKMQEMMRNYWEDAILNLINRFTALQTDSAEKRYLDLLNKPDYLKKIPQKYLASFLGVTPTSLSRIKKQITKKH